MVKVRQHKSTAPSQSEEHQVAEPGAESAQEEHRRMRDQPAEEFEGKQKHLDQSPIRPRARAGASFKCRPPVALATRIGASSNATPSAGDLAFDFHLQKL